MNTSSETWDELWSLSQRVDEKRIADAVFDDHPGLGWARRNILETEVGGKEIQEDIEYAKQSGEWFKKGQPLGTSWDNTVTAVFFKWRYFAVPFVIDITEEIENMNGRSARKLLAHRTQNALKSARDAISVSFWAAQTGQAMLGMQDLVPDDPTTGTLGGLARAGRSWWQSKNFTTAVDMDSPTNSIFAGPQRMNLIYNEASSGADTTDAVFMDETRFGDYQNIYTSANFARTGLRNPGGPVNSQAPPMNTATVYFDRHVGANHVYGLNKQWTHLKVARRLNFAKTPFRSPHNQLVKVAFIVVGMQATTNNPKRNWVMTNVT